MHAMEQTSEEHDQRVHFITNDGKNIVLKRKLVEHLHAIDFLNLEEEAGMHEYRLTIDLSSTVMSDIKPLLKKSAKKKAGSYLNGKEHALNLEHLWELANFLQYSDYLNWYDERKIRILTVYQTFRNKS